MWWLLPCAVAWTPGEPEAVALPSRPLDLAVLEGSSPLLLVLDDAHLYALQDDDIVARRPVDARHLLVSDLDGDSQSEVVLCGVAGVLAVPVAGRSLGAPIPLHGEPCEALAVREGHGGTELVATGPSGTVRIREEEGTLTSLALELVVAGPARLAVTPDLIAVGAVGSPTLLTWDEKGGGMIPLGSPLVDLVAVGDRLAWVRQEPADRVVVGADAVDAGGQVTHLAVPTPERFVAWGPDGWLLPRWPLPTGPLVVADLDQDGCDDVVIGTDEGIVRAHGTCEEPAAAAIEPDADIGPPPPPPVPEEEAPPPSAPDESFYNWPPRAWIDGERLRPADLPQPPEELRLDGPRPTLAAFVAQPVRTRLVVPGGTIDQLDGQPPGARLEGGVFVMDPVPWDIGRWSVSARVRPGEWYGFDVEVWPRPRPGDPVPVVTPSTESTATETVAAATPTDRWFHIDRCALGAGLAGGASQRGGLAWEELGAPEVMVRASPAVAALCDGGGVVRWVLGLDAAPWFRYDDQPTDRSHLIGATAGLQVGTDRFGLGPYGSAGVTAVNVGLRGQGFLSDRVGLELRAGWLAPRAGFEATALVLYRLGRR